MERSPSPEEDGGWVSVRHPRRLLYDRAEKSLVGSQSARRRRLVTRRSPSVSPPPSRAPSPSIDTGRWGNLRLLSSLPSPPPQPVVALESPVAASVPCPPPAIALACESPSLVRRGIPKNWPKHIPWRLPIYPTEEEWARAERTAKIEMRADGFEVSSSSEED